MYILKPSEPPALCSGSCSVRFHLAGCCVGTSGSNPPHTPRPPPAVTPHTPRPHTAPARTPIGPLPLSCSFPSTVPGSHLPSPLKHPPTPPVLSSAASHPPSSFPASAPWGAPGPCGSCLWGWAMEAGEKVTRGPSWACFPPRAPWRRAWAQRGLSPTASFVLAGDTQGSWRWGALVVLSGPWNEARKKDMSLVKAVKARVSWLSWTLVVFSQTRSWAP